MISRVIRCQRPGTDIRTEAPRRKLIGLVIRNWQADIRTGTENVDELTIVSGIRSCSFDADVAHGCGRLRAGWRLRRLGDGLACRCFCRLDGGDGGRK